MDTHSKHILHAKTDAHLAHSRPGHLPWSYIMRIAVANILHSRSRTMIATAAMAVGVGAVVLLVSFGYGLQNIIVQRLLRPNSLRLADVQTSSTALSLSPEALATFQKIPHVQDVAASVSLAGSMTYGNSKTEVVVVASTNKFLDLSSIFPIAGRVFSDKAEQRAQQCVSGSECSSEIEKLVSMVQKGEVAGVAKNEVRVTSGSAVRTSPVRFRVKEDEYVPLRSSPQMNAPVIGYTSGTLFNSYQGKEVWGGTYDAVNAAGKAHQDGTGTWWGKWVLASLPVYTKLDDSTFIPVSDGAGAQITKEGYIEQSRLLVLSDEEVILERQLDELHRKFGKDVLGESTAGAALESAASARNESISTDEAALKKLVFGDKEAEVVVTPSIELGMVEVKKLHGHEIIVSTGFLNALKLKPEHILKKQVTLEYIIGGGQIAGVAGRVLSKPVTYTVVGVVRDDKQSVVYTPLADVESTGVKKYTIAKLLVKDADALAGVREKIQSLGFITQSLTDTLTQIDKLFRLMRFLLGAFGAIALVVAVFGMFNTLTVSLLERTREIGVMKTLGTRDSDVVKLFMVESAIIAFFGGIFGVVLGILLGSAINIVTGFFRDDKTLSLFHTPPVFIIGILVSAVIIGLLTGLYPSLRSRSISALDALRYE